MGYAHVTLATRSVQESSRFFEATFGWRPLARPANVRSPAAWLQVARGAELHLLEVPDFAPSPFEHEYGRHVAVRYPRAEFESLKQRLTQHGAELIAPDRPTSFERFFFRDPNGYVFEVIASDTEEDA